MTDNEIKKALHICAEHEPFEGQQYTYCGIPLQLLFKEILAFVNRQQEEIERLNGCVKSEGEIRAIMKAQMEPMIKEATNEMFDRAVKVAKADATIEFAERLKKEKQQFVKARFSFGGEYISKGVMCADIDNLVAEMVGDSLCL